MDVTVQVLIDDAKNVLDCLFAKVETEDVAGFLSAVEKWVDDTSDAFCRQVRDDER